MVCNEGFKINEGPHVLCNAPTGLDFGYNASIQMALMDSEISCDLADCQIPLQEMNKIMKQAPQTPMIPAILYQQIFQKTRVKLHMTYV